MLLNKEGFLTSNEIENECFVKNNENELNNFPINFSSESLKESEVE